MTRADDISLSTDYLRRLDGPRPIILRRKQLGIPE